MRIHWPFSVLVLFSILVPGVAQSGRLPTLVVPYVFDSEVVQNPLPMTTVVRTESVNIPAAGGLQIRFSDIELSHPDDAVIITSTTDTEVQVLDESNLKFWRGHSAWFNGPEVQVSLRLGPMSAGRFAIAEVSADAPDTNDDLCGSDNRTLSTDGRVCRLVFSTSQTGGGCTGWLINAQSVVLSAGHCATAPSLLVIAEFDVPLSMTSGAIQHPPVSEQFPVDMSTIMFQDGGVGDDWAVMRLHPNSSGQTAANNQGFFTLATSIPPNGTLLRLTGFGADNAPDPTRNFVNQTSTGPLDDLDGTEISHEVDSMPGNSGGPIIDTQNGQAIGVHTHGGCDAFLGFGTNGGTSILHPGLQTAIVLTSGCGNMPLGSAIPQNLTCTPLVFNTSPIQGVWNIVAVSSPSDWDIHTTSSSSTLGGNACDWVVANGHSGTINPISGMLRRFSGSSNGTAQFTSAEPITVGVPLTSAFNSNYIVRVFEFFVPVQGAHEISIFGDPTLSWALVAPSQNPSWQSRTSMVSTAAGSVGAAGVAASLATGWHLLVVFRNGGPATTAPANVTISVCPGASSPVSLPANSTITVNAPCQEFTSSPVAFRWNVIGISGSSDWSLGMGSAYSASPGTSCEIVAANGTSTVVPITAGMFLRAGASGNATAQHVSASLMSIDAPMDSSLPSGQIIRAAQFNVSTAGTYNLTVTGDPSLRYTVFQPGTAGSWQAAWQAISFNTPGAGTFSLNLGTGNHAIVISRANGPAPTALPFTINVCTPAPLLFLSSTGTTAATLNNPCQTVLVTPTANSWNAVGISSLSDWDIAFGAAESQSAGSSCDFVLADSRAGAISPTSGVAARFSGSQSGRLQLAPISNLTVGSSLFVGWGATSVIHLLQFNVVTGGSYDLSLASVNGVNTYGWSLFRPATTSAWQTRIQGSSSGTSGTPPTTIALTPGWHAFVVFRDGGPGQGDTFEARVAPTPNPIPTLSTINPILVTAQGPQFTLTLTGSAFLQSSVARWNGTALATTYVSSTQLSATVPASLIAIPLNASITVFNPAPGGGTSATRFLLVQQPFPVLASISPSSANAGASGFTLSLSGSGFTAQSVARWNGQALATTFASSTSLSAAVPTALLTTAGQNSITVFNPSPGGGTSVSRNFTINNPAPTLTSVTPSAIAGGGPAQTLLCNGSGFVSSSVVRWNGSDLSTTLVSPTQLSAVLSASLIASTGSAQVIVFSPAPGGGTTATRTVDIIAPTILAVSPSSIPVQVSNAPATLLTVSGLGFHTGSRVIANGEPLTTTFVSSTQLTCPLPSAIPQTTRPGGIALTIENATSVTSNTRALIVGSGANQGTIRRQPLTTSPGQGYSALIEGGAANALFSLYADFANVSPLTSWPDPVGNMVLAVGPYAGSPGPFIPIIEGIGLHGPATGDRLDVIGAFTIPGFVASSPALGISLTVQGIYLDPSAPLGFRLTWARWPDRL